MIGLNISIKLSCPRSYNKKMIINTIPKSISSACRYLIAKALIVSVSILFFLGISTSETVQAQPERDGGFLVSGVAELPEYEGAANGRVVPFFSLRRPLLGGELQFAGLGADLDNYNHPYLRAGPAIRLVIPRSSTTVDQPEIQLLDDVGTAIEIGARFGFEIPFGRTDEDRLSGGITITQDVANAHGGSVISTDLKYFFKANRMLRFSIGINASWASSNYHETYFDVDTIASNASGLTSFDAGSGLKDVGAEIFNILSFSQQWGIFTRVAINRLSGDAADSPIVGDIGDRYLRFMGLGVFYNWQ